MASKKRLLQLLEALVDIVQNSSDEEIGGAIEALTKITAKPVAKKLQFSTKRPTIKDTPDRRAIDIRQALDSLQYVRSREDGLLLLERYEFNKQALESLARHLDIQVVREDNSRRLMEKIVERSIGSLLNSQAIRGFVSST